MIENVTIVDKNGNGILAEGIMYVNIKSSDISIQGSQDKKYVFYTLNEEIENGQTKIYISEAADGENKANPILDAEWKRLKDLMISISHEDIPKNIEFIKMSGMTFYVNEPKKLAIKAPVRQALKDAYFSGIIATQQQSAIEENSPVFFDSSMLENNDVEKTLVEDKNTINAFESMPQETANSNINNAFDQPILTNIVDNTMQEMAQPSQPQLAQPVVQPNNVKVVVGKPMPIVINTGGIKPTNLETKIENQVTSVEPLIDNNILNLDNSSVIATEPQQVITDKPLINQENLLENKETENRSIVTKEEAIEALKILNRYFGINISEATILEKAIKEDNEVLIDSNQGLESTEEDFELKLSEEMQEEFNNHISESLLLPNDNQSIDNGLNNPINNDSINYNALSESTNSAAENLSVPIVDIALPQISMDEANNNQPNEMVGFIDTSVQGLSAPINNDAQGIISSVNFDIPAIPEISEVNSQDVMKPMSAPPTFNNEIEIPMMAPMPLEEPSNEYTATSNQGAAVVTSNMMTMQNMPAVTMPDNAVGVTAATMNMMEAGNLGPSGLTGQES